MLSYEFIDPEEQISSKDFSFIESFLKMTTRTQIGWHYFTDLTWLYSRIQLWPRSYKILDAGGGCGPLQFLLAEMGFKITNIDMLLPEPSLINRRRYSTTLTQLSSFQPTNYQEHLFTFTPPHLLDSIKNLVKGFTYVNNYNLKKYTSMHDFWRNKFGFGNVPIGKIKWIIGNLCNMPEIENDSFDAVVSLSALEHIPINQLGNALSEIGRVLKPEAKWAITTSGTERGNTWFHEPSKGYCFSVKYFKEKFNAKSFKKQNPKEIFQKYKENGYLKENIAQFYFKSGNNGMPWGKWAPQYIPVGIYN